MRKPAFVNPTQTKLNLGAFDWTVEFWYRPGKDTGDDGVVFELGRGPRGDNDEITSLLVRRHGAGFLLRNQPAGVALEIPSSPDALRPGASWAHFAFSYSAAEGQLRHYVNGLSQRLPPRVRLRSVEVGEQAYFTVARDGRWERPLAGPIDELRFSEAVVYTGPFTPPDTFAPRRARPVLQRGLPLLFDPEAAGAEPLRLGARKHVFLDDALVAASQPNAGASPGVCRPGFSITGRSVLPG